MKEFLKRKNVVISADIYLIKVLGAMAMGLFASLLIGTILKTIGETFSIPFLSETVWPIAKDMTGPAIAIAVANALNAPPLVLYSVVTVGFAGNRMGGVVGALLATLFATEIGKIVSKETKLDIIVTPAITIVVGVLIAIFVGPSINSGMIYIGDVIMEATKLRPFLMGIIISVIVGIVLTLPISSAALCMMLSLSGLAAGAATAGCCAQMIGFAVISFRDNGINGLVAQGLGTSMLQVPNIIKNWKIWIPPTLASAITGPMATTIFKMENIPAGAGMGTSGLVGQVCTIVAMEGMNKINTYIGIALLHFILPAILSYIFYEIMRKMGQIKDGDMKLDL